MSLTSKQRAFLKSEAHTLKPIVQIGKLIKVTLLQNTMEDIHEVAEILEEEIGCDTVLKIGRILILYKESAKKENRKLSPKVKAIPK